MPEQPDEDNRRDPTTCEVGFSSRIPRSALEVARHAEAFAARWSVLGVGARPNLFSADLRGTRNGRVVFIQPTVVVGFARHRVFDLRFHESAFGRHAASAHSLLRRIDAGGAPSVDSAAGSAILGGTFRPTACFLRNRDGLEWSARAARTTARKRRQGAVGIFMAKVIRGGGSCVALGGRRLGRTRERGSDRACFRAFRRALAGRCERLCFASECYEGKNRELRNAHPSSLARTRLGGSRGRRGSFEHAHVS
jgi:hypothetical protein